MFVGFWGDFLFSALSKAFHDFFFSVLCDPRNCQALKSLELPQNLEERETRRDGAMKSGKVHDIHEDQSKIPSDGRFTVLFLKKRFGDSEQRRLRAAGISFLRITEQEVETRMEGNQGHPECR